MFAENTDMLSHVSFVNQSWNINLKDFNEEKVGFCFFSASDIFGKQH